MIINGRLRRSSRLRIERYKLALGITSHASDADYDTPESDVVVPPTDGGVVVSFNFGVIYNFYNDLEVKSLTSFKRNYFFDNVYQKIPIGVTTTGVYGIISSYFNSKGYYRFWLHLRNGTELFSDDSLAANPDLKSWAESARSAILAHKEENYILFTFEDSSNNIFGTSAKLYFNKGQARVNTMYQISCPMDDSTSTVKDGFTTDEEVFLYIQNGEGVKVKVDYTAVSKQAVKRYVIDITEIKALSTIDYKVFNRDFWRVLIKRETDIV